MHLELRRGTPGRRAISLENARPIIRMPPDFPFAVGNLFFRAMAASFRASAIVCVSGFSTNTMFAK